MAPTKENTKKLSTRKYIQKTKICIEFPEKWEHTEKIYALRQIPINTMGIMGCNWLRIFLLTVFYVGGKESIWLVNG